MTSDCILTHARLCEWGYGIVWYEGKLQKHHRVVFFQSNNYWPKVVMHKCDNPACINIEHLVAGTVQYNNMDRMKKSRNGRLDGSRNGRSKITESDAIEIRDLYKTGIYTQTSIGEMYSISQTQVSKIVLGQSFKGYTKNSDNSPTER